MPVIAICSGKGGVGKTLIAANIAYHLTQQNKKVTIIDFDLSSPSLHILFNIANPKKTLKQIIFNTNCNINDLTYETSIKNLKVICGSSNILGLKENSDLLVKKMMASVNNLKTDFVIFDLGTGLNRFDTNLFIQAHTGILIGTPEPTTILENFNFLKLCILQKLEVIYKGQHQKLSIIREAYNNYSTKINEQIKFMIKNLNSNSESFNKNDQLQFHPKFILNMVHDDSDYPYASAIDIALKEMLGLELKLFETIPFCNQMRNYLKTNSVSNILQNSNGAKSCYQNITSKLLNKSVENILTNQSTTINKLITTGNNFSKHNEQLICSSNCSLWDSCTYQHGGYPCKIKYIGFFNTN